MRWDDLKVRISTKVKRGEVWLHPDDHRAMFSLEALASEVAHAKRLPDAMRFPNIPRANGGYDYEAARAKNMAQMDELRRKAGGDG